MVRVNLRGGHLVKKATTAVNLGITLQSKLSWKDHISKIKEKAIKSIWALSSIKRSTFGGNYHTLPTILKAVIIPQLAYGALMWYTPTGEKGNKKTLFTQLVQAQGTEARLITGAFKATSDQAPNIKVHLTPIDLELDKTTIQTAARLLSGPLYHTLTEGRSTYVKRTLTPLENLKNTTENLLIAILTNSKEDRPILCVLGGALQASSFKAQRKEQSSYTINAWPQKHLCK